MMRRFTKVQEGYKTPSSPAFVQTPTLTHPIHIDQDEICHWSFTSGYGHACLLCCLA